MFETEIREMLSLLDSLGSLCTAYGENDEAIAHYERSLRIKEKAFGVDHINTAYTIMNIGLFYQSRGKVKLAESWLLRGHQIFVTSVGEQHPDTMKAVAIIVENTLKAEIK
jgi:hypothetical protein